MEEGVTVGASPPTHTHTPPAHVWRLLPSTLVSCAFPR